ncbi:MAG: PspA/IM30 family protein [Microcystaceae cyanobacterium]
MGLLKRIGGMIRSQINGFVSEAEDPEQVLEETVAAMEQEVIEMRRALAAAIATHKRTERQVTKYQTSSQKWYERAQMAVEKGNEVLARDALMRRQSYQSNLQILADQMTEQRNVIQKIKTNLLDLEKKYMDARAKKNLYIARLRSAAAHEKFQSFMDDLHPNSTAKAFEQIEAKIIELEAKSSALADPLEEKFLSLEDNQKVDQQLEVMKQKRLDSSSEP